MCLPIWASDEKILLYVVLQGTDKHILSFDLSLSVELESFQVKGLRQTYLWTKGIGIWRSDFNNVILTNSYLINFSLFILYLIHRSSHFSLQKLISRQSHPLIKYMYFISYFAH